MLFQTMVERLWSKSQANTQAIPLILFVERMLKMINLFNCWHDSQHSKTTIIADDMNHALDIFCSRHGFIDHADYCQEKNLTESDINIESVN